MHVRIILVLISTVLEYFQESLRMLRYLLKTEFYVRVDCDEKMLNGLLTLDEYFPALKKEI